MSYLSLPSGAVARPLISGVTNAAGLRAVAQVAQRFERVSGGWGK